MAETPMGQRIGECRNEVHGLLCKEFSREIEMERATRKVAGEKRKSSLSKEERFQKYVKYKESTLKGIYSQPCIPEPPKLKRLKMEDQLSGLPLVPSELEDYVDAASEKLNDRLLEKAEKVRIKMKSKDYPQSHPGILTPELEDEYDPEDLIEMGYKTQYPIPSYPVGKQPTTIEENGHQNKRLSTGFEDKNTIQTVSALASPTNSLTMHSTNKFGHKASGGKDSRFDFPSNARQGFLGKTRGILSPKRLLGPHHSGQREDSRQKHRVSFADMAQDKVEPVGLRRDNEEMEIFEEDRYNIALGRERDEKLYSDGQLLSANDVIDDVDAKIDEEVERSVRMGTDQNKEWVPDAIDAVDPDQDEQQFEANPEEFFDGDNVEHDDNKYNYPDQDAHAESQVTGTFTHSQLSNQVPKEKRYHRPNSIKGKHNNSEAVQAKNSSLTMDRKAKNYSQLTDLKIITDPDEMQIDVQKNKKPHQERADGVRSKLAVGAGGRQQAIVMTNSDDEF